MPLSACIDGGKSMWEAARKSIEKAGGGAFMTEYGALGPNQASAVRRARSHGRWRAHAMQSLGAPRAATGRADVLACLAASRRSRTPATGMSPPTHPPPSSQDLITFMLDEAERLGQSSAYWSWKSFNDITTQNGVTETLYNEDGSLQLPKLRALTRSYAPAVAAVPGTVFSRFDSATGTYTLKVRRREPRGSCLGPSR